MPRDADPHFDRTTKLKIWTITSSALENDRSSNRMIQKRRKIIVNYINIILCILRMIVYDQNNM